MSGPRTRIIHPNADHDLINLLERSCDVWGERQALIYARLIDKALETITAFPQIGQRRDDLNPGLRTHPVGHHLILYEERERAIVVLRIVDQRKRLDDLAFE
ncbi:MAG: type II toxin-antitoxin system RelE/ParE family toxin [Thermomicrobiales bacterium]